MLPWCTVPRNEACRLVSFVYHLYIFPSMPKYALSMTFAWRVCSLARIFVAPLIKISGEMWFWQDLTVDSYNASCINWNLTCRAIIRKHISSILFFGWFEDASTKKMTTRLVPVKHAGLCPVKHQPLTLAVLCWVLAENASSSGK